MAQSADDSGQAVQSEPGGEIIVTARKRDERLLDVPVAISALSAEQIDRYAIDTLTAVSQQVPSLIIAESQNQVGGSINLRGIGAGISNPSTESAVTINIDGIPVSYGNAIRLGQIDLGRVEVLKGPQALFYGKNSPGGVISLISQDPTNDLLVQLRTGYEFKAKQRFGEAIVSGPLGENFGARVVGYYSKEDGWFQNISVAIPSWTPGPGADSLNGEQKFVRGTLKYDSPDGGTSARAKVAYGKKTRDGVGPTASSQIVKCQNGDVSVWGATNCKADRYFYSQILPDDIVATSSLFGDGVPFTSSRQFIASLAVDQQLGDTLTLSSVTGYYKLSEDSLDEFTFSNATYYAATNDLSTDGLSQELRLTSDFDGPLQFMLGGFYQDAGFNVRQVFTYDFGTPTVAGSTFYDIATKATSLFGQLRYELTDQLELAAGGRYSWEKKTLTGTSAGYEFEVLNPTQKYHDFSPEVTLTYKPSTDTTMYAAYREGFTSGGFNTAVTALRTSVRQDLPALDRSYGQMTAKGGELGVKGYFAERQASYDIVAYNFKYSGLQLSRYDQTTFSQLTQNAGGARSKGVEASLTMRPDQWEGLSLNTSVAYNDAHYTDFIGGCYGGQSISQGCNLNPKFPNLDPSTYGTSANAYQDQDQTGQQLFRAPKWTLTAGAVYDHEIGDNLGFSIAADTNHSSSYITQTEGSPRTRQDAYWMFNASVSLNGGADKLWEVSLIGRNLSNKLVVGSGSIVGATSSGTGTPTSTAGDVLGGLLNPRSVLLQLTVRNSLFGG